MATNIPNQLMFIEFNAIVEDNKEQKVIFPLWKLHGITPVDEETYEINTDNYTYEITKKSYEELQQTLLMYGHLIKGYIDETFEKSKRTKDDFNTFLKEVFSSKGIQLDENLAKFINDMEDRYEK